MHYKDDDLTKIMSLSNRLYDYTENWIQIIYTIQELIKNNVYVFDLKLENIVYQKDLDNQRIKFKFYLIDLGGYMIFEDTFISKYNEFINTFPLIYEYMNISKNNDNDTYNLKFDSDCDNGKIFPLQNITLEQLKNILYYNVLYSLLVSILIFLMYQRKINCFNTLIDTFIYKKKNIDNILNLPKTLEEKHKISFNIQEQNIYYIIQQLVYFCNDIDIIKNVLNEQIFTFENIIDILNGNNVF